MLATLANNPLAFQVTIEIGFFGTKGMNVEAPISPNKTCASWNWPLHKREATSCDSHPVSTEALETGAQVLKTQLLIRLRHNLIMLPRETDLLEVTGEGNHFRLLEN